MKREINLGDIVKVLKGQFADKIGTVVGMQVFNGDYADTYYEVEMQCEVPEMYKSRDTLNGQNNTIGGLNADELEVIYPTSLKQRSILRDYLNQILALQEKNAILECECRRFTDWVINFTRDCRSVALHFDNEYLTLAAQKMVVNLRPKTAEEKEAERKKFSDAVNDAFNKTIGTELKK